jgi:hypothetical protein
MPSLFIMGKRKTKYDILFFSMTVNIICTCDINVHVKDNQRRDIGNTLSGVSKIVKAFQIIFF